MVMEIVPAGEPERSPASADVIVTIELPCGHVYKPDFDQGDRQIECPHGRKYVVRSHRRTVVTYEVTSCS
jgi:hypothetical protein